MTRDLDDVCLQRHTLLKGGAYRIEERLASSELSIVYIGSPAEGEGKLAIKEFYPGSLALRDMDGKTVLCRRPSSRRKFVGLSDAFRREASVLSRLRHRHIVEYIDHFEENGTSYLVTRYCPGKPLADLIREEKPSAAYLIRNVLLPLLDTVDFIHRQGILHRDLKPGNMMISEEGEPVLLDFGSAVSLAEPDVRPIFTTAGFSPLELYSEKARQGKKADLFSAAAILYYSFTGRVPADVSERLIEDRMESARTANPEVGLLLSGMIRWGLAVEPRRRCPSLTLLKAALRLEYVRLKAGKRRNRLEPPSAVSEK
ncbi:serine/threonine-protein kinase [Paenibacillus ehimensis]|uniref:serine/threonine protein kinase n=1 Tax=Paenibacillus ehimensis TaxID=79264 RepID=UPI002DBFFAFC|nr:serine/threonine-protein kinase [Paenibacillus ehimensis]MEC0213727.1 serine/threonine-protein kinase [Paenibacillus ehimensis]